VGEERRAAEAQDLPFDYARPRIRARLFPTPHRPETATNPSLHLGEWRRIARKPAAVSCTSPVSQKAIRARPPAPPAGPTFRAHVDSTGLGAPTRFRRPATMAPARDASETRHAPGTRPTGSARARVDTIVELAVRCLVGPKRPAAASVVRRCTMPFRRRLLTSPKNLEDFLQISRPETILGTSRAERLPRKLAAQTPGLPRRRH